MATMLAANTNSMLRMGTMTMSFTIPDAERLQRRARGDRA